MELNNRKKYSHGIVASVIITGLLIYFAITFFYHRIDPNRAGTFGDIFGGILNPLIAAFALYYLKLTYDISNEELEQTKKELQANREDARRNEARLRISEAMSTKVQSIRTLSIDGQVDLKECIDNFLVDIPDTIGVAQLDIQPDDRTTPADYDFMVERIETMIKKLQTDLNFYNYANAIRYIINIIDDYGISQRDARLYLNEIDAFVLHMLCIDESDSLLARQLLSLNLTDNNSLFGEPRHIHRLIQMIERGICIKNTHTD